MKGVLADGAGGEVDDKIVMLKYVRAFMGRPWRAAAALQLPPLDSHPNHQVEELVWGRGDLEEGRLAILNPGDMRPGKIGPLRSMKQREVGKI